MPWSWIFHATDGQNNYQLEWQNGPTKPAINKNGTSGWAKVVCRTYTHASGPPVDGNIFRVHSCAKNPCQAVLAPSTYGLMGPPLHMQPTAWRPDVVKAAGVAEDATVVDGEQDPSSDSSSESSAESTAATDAQPLGSKQTDGEDLAVTAEPAVAATFPPPPAEAPLRPASAAMPAPPPPPSSSTCTDLPVRAPDVPAFAVASLLDKIMALGRSIRRERGHVGHSAFVLFGLL